MKRIDLLITRSRKTTENDNFSDTQGIDDEEFLQYFNDGQDEIQSIIFNSFPDALQVETTISAIAGQEAYNIPSDAFLGNRVEVVEYSPTGNSSDYIMLKKGAKRERISGVQSTPSYYIRRSKQILLQPQPQDSSGLIRILYQKRVSRLDIRRATVSAVTLGASSITSLSFDTTSLLDDSALLEEDRITIVGREGEVKMKNVLIDSINTSTGVVTVNSGFTFDSGETIAVGDYAVRGQDSTTHSQLPQITEKYLLEYANLRINMRDSSQDSGAISSLLQKIESTIKEAFSEPDGEVNYIPILDSQYLEAED